MNIEQLLKSLLDIIEYQPEKNGRYTEEIEIEITIENKSIIESVVMNNVQSLV